MVRKICKLKKEKPEKSCKVGSLKAVKLPKEQNKISTDVVFMVDEMYLQKCAQFAGGDTS